MNLLYITFGENAFVHSQAAFSIYSFLAQEPTVTSITVITDAPQFYTHVKDHVNVLPVTDAQLKDWKGPHDFFWRIKLKAIEWICAEYPDKPVMYLDTDTFLYGSLQSLQLLVAKQAVMHEEEGELSKKSSKTERKMWKQVKGKKFGGVEITPAESMWNAGVVAIPNTTNREECTMALKICDEMCAAGVKRRLIEQFALSVALNKFYGLAPADKFIAHYWSNKAEWDKAITHFFTTAYCKGATSTKQMLLFFTQFEYKKVAVKKISKNTSNRLHRWVDQVFKTKEEFIK